MDHEKWVDKCGQLHSDQGPALIGYRDDGSVFSVSYFCHGQRHRVDGPAYVGYHPNGIVAAEMYYIEGKLHREEGPAGIEFRENGSRLRDYCYIDGQQYQETWYSLQGFVFRPWRCATQSLPEIAFL